MTMNLFEIFQLIFDIFAVMCIYDLKSNQDKKEG